MADKKEDPHIAAVKAATTKYERAREAVEQAIFAAYRTPGVKRTDIAAASPWTAAHVRKLVRDEGIGPDPAYESRAEAIRNRATRDPAGSNGDLPPLRPADIALKHVGDLTARQLTSLVERAFQKAVTPAQDRMLTTASSDGGDRAVVEAALEAKLLTAVDLQIAE